MSIVSYEGRTNMFMYRDIKFRVQVMLDPSKSVIRYNVYAKFSDGTNEERIASKAGAWNSEGDAVAEAQTQAQLYIDEFLKQE
ncbi:hypothetical protein [Pseudomonas sp. Sample_22]|uniref:hypothetical protein n=1 Tax=Pseudomonas sp. Sample_22 TaxID=2448266 RepID=UPI00103296B6|nr:hypothetical protein [Pseudomonas sp. Sample_22]